MTLKELTEMDDLISRWEAIKAVMDDENITNAMDSANDGEMHRTKRAASRIIAGLPSAQQWIPCSERLPDELAEVNVTWVNTAPPVYYEFLKGKRFTGTAVYFDGEWYWYSSTCLDMLKEYGKNPADIMDGAIEVIAWMPLPKPYEVKQ